MSSTSTALRITLHTQLHLKMVKSNKPRFVSSEDGGRYPANGMLNSGSSKTSIPDVVTHDLQSLNLHGGGDDCRSFLLLDQDEELCVESVEAW